MIEPPQLAPSTVEELITDLQARHPVIKGELKTPYRGRSFWLCSNPELSNPNTQLHLEILSLKITN